VNLQAFLYHSPGQGFPNQGREPPVEL